MFILLDGYLGYSGWTWDIFRFMSHLGGRYDTAGFGFENTFTIC